MLNKTFLQGRLARDPEMIATRNGNSGVRFTVANKKWNGDTQFVRCVAWGKQADNILQYFKKGNWIIVEGEIDISEQEVDGVKKTYMDINVNKFNFCGDKPKSKDEDNLNQTPIAAYQDDENEELPF